MLAILDEWRRGDCTKDTTTMLKNNSEAWDTAKEIRSGFEDIMEECDMYATSHVPLEVATSRFDSREIRFFFFCVVG